MLSIKRHQDKPNDNIFLPTVYRNCPMMSPGLEGLSPSWMTYWAAKVPVGIRLELGPAGDRPIWRNDWLAQQNPVVRTSDVFCSVKYSDSASDMGK